MNASRTTSQLLGLAADEVLAERSSPDLTRRLQSASPRDRQQAAQRASDAEAAWKAAAAPPRGPRIAAGLLAAIVVGAVLLDTGDRENEGRAGSPETAPPSAVPTSQDLHRDVVHPRDFAEFRKLLAKASAARIQTGSTLPSSALDAGSLNFLRTEIAKGLASTVAKHPFVFDPVLELTAQIDPRRVLILRVERTHDQPRTWFVRVQGLSLHVANSKTVAKLKTWLARHRQQLRRSVAEVRRLDQLRALQKMPAADRPTQLQLIGLTATALPLLEPLTNLRNLDVSASPALAGSALATHPIAAHITRLRLTTAQLGEKPDWIHRFPRLQHLTLTAPAFRAETFVNGSLCITCHAGGGNRPQSGLPVPRGLHRSRSLRSLALQGVVMTEALWKLIRGLPMLERLDLSCSQLDGLDTDALKSLSGLRALLLGGAIGLEDEDFEFLSTQTHLRQLDLRGTLPMIEMNPQRQAGTHRLTRIRTALPKCDVRG